MGIVVRFRRHARASAGSDSNAERACSSASRLSVTLDSRRFAAAATRSAQNSAGMRFRECHLRTAQIDSPKSPATFSSAGRGHSRKRDCTASSMPEVLGPIVLKVKANVSCDDPGTFGDIPAMADRMSETEEKAAFIGRVRAAREARYPKQGPMLIILGTDQGTYKQYETRTPLPYRFIPKFCAACGVSIEWLLTGEGAGPMVVPLPAKRKRAVHSKPQRRHVA